MQEVKVVQVHGDDFLFREISLQLDCNHPFDRLLQEALHRVVSLLGIELLGQLLRDGGTTAGTRLSHDATLQDSAPQGDEVDTRMLIEALVLGGYQSSNKSCGQLLVADHDSVFLILVIRTQLLSIGRIDDGCILADGILKVLNIWHVTDESKPNGKESCYERNAHQSNHQP